MKLLRGVAIALVSIITVWGCYIASMIVGWSLGLLTAIATVITVITGLVALVAYVVWEVYRYYFPEDK